MKNQEVFDRVWTHFIVEKNPKSLNDEGYCAYRGENGAMCAAGLFIPDECYSPDMEGTCITEVASFREVKDVFKGINLRLLENLQEAHDDSGHYYQDMKDRFENVARDWGLKIP